MVEAKTENINRHILEKIAYHKELKAVMQAEEEYLKCAYHRDEIKRLTNMLS
jgi:protein-arginine kinase activator protein McsA